MWTHFHKTKSQDYVWLLQLWPWNPFCHGHQPPLETHWHPVPEPNLTKVGDVQTVTPTVADNCCRRKCQPLQTHTVWPTWALASGSCMLGWVHELPNSLEDLVSWRDRIPPWNLLCLNSLLSNAGLRVPLNGSNPQSGHLLSHIDFAFARVSLPTLSCDDATAPLQSPLPVVWTSWLGLSYPSHQL